MSDCRCPFSSTGSDGNNFFILWMSGNDENSVTNNTNRQTSFRRIEQW